MKEYRIKVVVKNNLLLSAIEAAGYKSIAEFCRANGMIDSQVAALVAMRDRPLRETGEFSKTAKALMEALGAAPSDLWTEEQLYLKLHKNSAERAVDRADIHHFLESEQSSWTLPSPEDQMIRAEASAVIEQVLEAMPERRKAVLKARYWDDQTLEDAAKTFGVTRERVRQMEARALRDLRHPKNKILKEISESC